MEDTGDKAAGEKRRKTSNDKEEDLMTAWFSLDFCAPTMHPMWVTLCTIITICTCSTWNTDLKQRASIVCGDNWQTSSCGLVPHSFRTNKADTTGLYCFWPLMSLMTSEVCLVLPCGWLRSWHEGLKAIQTASISFKKCGCEEWGSVEFGE